MDAFSSGKFRATNLMLAAALCGLALLALGSSWIAVKAETLQTPEPAQISTEPTGEPLQAGSGTLRWTLEYSIPADERQTGALALDSLQTVIAAKLSDPAVGYRLERAANSAGVETYRLSLQGDGGLEQFRQVVWTDLKDDIRLLSGPADLILSGPAAAGQILPVVVDGNYSAGYRWELAADSSASLSAPVQYGPVSGLLGSAQQIRLPLRAGPDGRFSAHLVYRRPFEPVDQPDVRISLEAAALPGEIDLSNPEQPGAAQTLPLVERGPSALAVVSGEIPTQYDWRQYATLTPIRNQGSCGSCWAFGTVGLLESALAIQDGDQVDLSEQYLVNCNDYNYNCDRGGWWDANNYHQSAYKSPPQTGAGAVLEAHLPYSASTNSCAAAYEHPYTIRDWNYIDGYWPSVTAIKQAILNYGPVGTALCVGNYFAAYRGGIFNTDESAVCGGGINHAVVVVGWDDNNGQGYWILRNSWGSGWGEGGYMRMRYNTSNIGYLSVYIDYLLKPSVPGLLSPADGALVTSSRPAFSWSAGRNTQGYEFQLATDSAFTNMVDSTAPTSPTYSPAFDLTPDTRYSWRVRAWMDNSTTRLYGNWSAARSLKTSPNTPALAAPISGATVDSLRPELSWSGPDGVSDYDLQISSSPVFSTRLVSTQVAGLRYQPSANLPRSSWLYWRVRSRGVYGSGPWSETFSLLTPNPPAAPLLSQPIGGAVVRPERPVVLKWLPVSGASGYQIQVSSGSQLASLLDLPEQSENTLVLDGKLAPNSRFYWRVRAYNGSPTAYGPWSAARSLNTTPAVVVPSTPAAGAAVDRLRPEFTWSEPDPGLRYDLEIHRNSACTYLFRSASGLSAPAFTPAADLPRQLSLFWRVRARGLYGAGGWSACQSFVLPDPPSVPILSSPMNGAVLPMSQPFRPALAWQPAVHGVLRYQLQLTGAASFDEVEPVEVLSNSYIWPVDLATGTYRWRVRSVGQDAHGAIYSSWSAVRLFKTPAALQGTVSDYASGTPLANAVVTIAGTSYSAVSGADGSYFMAIVPSGARTITVQAPGYLSMGKTFTILAGGVRTLDFRVR